MTFGFFTFDGAPAVREFGVGDRERVVNVNDLAADHGLPTEPSPGYRQGFSWLKGQDTAVVGHVAQPISLDPVEGGIAGGA
jgi:hypothetical protein